MGPLPYEAICSSVCGGVWLSGSFAETIGRAGIPELPVAGQRIVSRIASTAATGAGQAPNVVGGTGE